MVPAPLTLALIAKGYEVSVETKRLDMDERKEPWPIIVALWPSGEMLTSPFANHDTLGLKFMNTNLRYLGWGSEAIKKRYGPLRTAGSVVSPPFPNTGQNDQDALPNYLHFADHLMVITCSGALGPDGCITYPSTHMLR